MATAALAAAVRPAATPLADDGAELVFPGVERPHDGLAEAMGSARSTRFKPVGTSSLVFQMRLQGDVDAAFRPPTRRHPKGHLAEVAAYRIARALGMEHVPPVVLRTVTRSELRQRLHVDYRDAWSAIDEEIAWAPNGTVEGAAVFWIPEMRNLGLDEDPGLSAWTEALQQRGDPHPTETTTLRDLSRMVAFDYLVANPDRFSGSNAQGLPGDPDRVFVRDHNITFVRPLSRRLHERLRRNLRRTERFSRGFVAGLLELDRTRLETLLVRTEGEAGPLLLDEARVADVLDRREGLLSYVVALVDRHGIDAVLAYD